MKISLVSGLLLAAVIHVADLEPVSVVYGVPWSDPSSIRPSSWDHFSRRSKSLLNTFPFNQPGLRRNSELAQSIPSSVTFTDGSSGLRSPAPGVQNFLAQSNSARQSSPGGSSLSFNNLLQALEGAGATRSPDYPEYDDSTDVTGAGVGEKTTTESGLQGENNSTPGSINSGLDSSTENGFQTSSPNQSGSSSSSSSSSSLTGSSGQGTGSSGQGTGSSGQGTNQGQADKKKCVDKVMMVEETVYEEIVQCDHSYDRRCHTSYSTSFQATQEEVCKETYRKNCFIDMEPVAFNTTVKKCRSPLVKDCSKSGKPICRTEYESECSTRNTENEIEEDVADCKTVIEKQCEDVALGYTTETKCKDWPRNVCTVKTQKIKKYSPETTCEKVPTELCAPPGCGFKEGPEICEESIKTIVQEKPSEECSIEPQRVCEFVTKMVPKLEPIEECVDVPKEICSRSRVATGKEQRPIIKRWCYTPTVESGLQ